MLQNIQKVEEFPENYSNCVPQCAIHTEQRLTLKSRNFQCMNDFTAKYSFLIFRETNSVPQCAMHREGKQSKSPTVKSIFMQMEYYFQPKPNGPTADFKSQNYSIFAKILSHLQIFVEIQVFGIREKCGVYFVSNYFSSPKMD